MTIRAWRKRLLRRVCEEFFIKLKEYWVKKKGTFSLKCGSTKMKRPVRVTNFSKIQLFARIKISSSFRHDFQTNYTIRRPRKSWNSSIRRQLSTDGTRISRGNYCMFWQGINSDLPSHVIRYVCTFVGTWWFNTSRAYLDDPSLRECREDCGCVRNELRN